MNYYINPKTDNFDTRSSYRTECGFSCNQGNLQLKNNLCKDNNETLKTCLSRETGENICNSISAPSPTEYQPFTGFFQYDNNDKSISCEYNAKLIQTPTQLLEYKKLFGKPNKYHQEAMDSILTEYCSLDTNDGCPSSRRTCSRMLSTSFPECKNIKNKYESQNLYCGENPTSKDCQCILRNENNEYLEAEQYFPKKNIHSWYKPCSDPTNYLIPKDIDETIKEKNTDTCNQIKEIPPKKQLETIKKNPNIEDCFSSGYPTMLSESSNDANSKSTKNPITIAVIVLSSFFTILLFIILYVIFF